MSSILIVEHEGRYIERIQDALSSEGWQPRFVAGRPEALRAAASEEPSLVLINANLPGAAELLRTFARSNGGPGSVALVAEHVDDDEAGRIDADEVLVKPFTDQELRLVVRRGLARARGGGRAEKPAAEAAGDGAQPDTIPVDGLGDGSGDMLTSADIFGDLLAEVEAEVEVGVGGQADGGTGETAAGDDADRSPAGEEAPPATRQPSPGREIDDPEIARRLEQTLSGVLGPRKQKPKPKPAATGDDAEAAQRRRRRNTDVDELLNLTLSSLDEPPKKKRSRTADAPFADLDLSEIEALASGVRRKPRREPPAEPPAETPPEAPAELPAEAPAEAGSDPGEASWADVARAVEETPPVAPSGAGAPHAPESQPEPAAAPPDEVERFGHYALLDRIAVGGMAEVWKARMRGVEGFQKTVAIKKILPQMTDNTDFVTMFIDEAKLAAQLNHPNITHIYDLGKIGREHYIAMEYVDGPNLRSVLNQARAKGKPLPIGLALLIAARLASALDYAHRKRDFDGQELELVHRDVSPQNVLLAYEGDIKLCDFGIVKAVTKASHTQMGALKGKLQYMSPEQAWGQTVDSRSDIFSLGSLLFEMLTGERLFAGDNEISVLDAVRECQTRSPREINPAVPEQADAVVSKALAKQPEDRHATAGEMQGELEAILYRLKPTPGQADLADYLHELEAAAALDDEARARFSWAAATAPPQTAGGQEATEAEAGGEEEAGEEGEEEIELIFEDDDADSELVVSSDGGDEDDEVVELLEIEDEPAGAAASILPDDDFGAAATQRVAAFDPAPELHPPEAREEEGGDDGEDSPDVDGIMAALAARETKAEAASGAAAAIAPPLTPPTALPPADHGGDGGTLDPTGSLDSSGDGSAVGALAPPQAEVEIEEGGGRGRWLLIAAIVLVILLGAAAWYFYFRGATPAPSGEAVEPPVASEPAAQPPVTEPAPADAEAAGEEGSEAGPAEDEAAAGAATGGVALDDLQEIVDQELAKREEEIRREQEERVRRLERQLREAQAEAARAREETAEGEDGGQGGQ